MQNRNSKVDLLPSASLVQNGMLGDVADIGNQRLKNKFGSVVYLS